MMVILLLLLIPNILLSLSLDEAICKAELMSYEVMIKEQEVRIKEGEVWQASLIPNPALDVEVDSFGGNGPFRGIENTIATYEIQTLLELGGKRGQRTQAASLDKLLAQWDVEETKVGMLTQLKIAFLDAFVSQEKLKINKKYLENTKQVLELAEENLRLGREKRAEVGKLKIAYLQAVMEGEKQEQDFLLKKNKLSNFWNESCPQFSWLEFNVESVPYLSALCTYEQNLLYYPGLVRQKLLVDRAVKEVDVQKAYAWPDVLLSLGVDHGWQQGNLGMRVEVNFPLPIFNQNQGKIYSARQQILQAEFSYKQLYLELLLEIRKIYKYLMLALEEVQLYQKEILPDLEETHRGAVEAYREGKMDLLTYLENEKFFLETRKSFLETLASFHKYYAELCQYIRSIP